MINDAKELSDVLNDVMDIYGELNINVIHVNGEEYYIDCLSYIKENDTITIELNSDDAIKIR